MGQISLTVPAVGSPRGTAESNINSDLGTIQTVINGQLDDTNLRSPNAAVRRVLLQGATLVDGGTSSGDYLLCANVFTGGGTVGTGVPMWTPDVGLNSQPTDFQVPNKLAYGRVRATVCYNGVAPGTSVFVYLGSMTTASGSGHLSLAWTQVTGSATNVQASTSNGCVGLESAQFALPGGTLSNAYALAFQLTPNPTAPNSTMNISAQLLAYNA